MWDEPLLIALFAMDVFVAFTAIGGGIAILAGLERSNFPLSWLDGTPFRTFTVPGLILAVAVGGVALAAALALPIDSSAGAVLSLTSGIVLTGWIIGEIRLLNTPGVSKTEIVYLIIGLAQAVTSVAYLVIS